MLSIWIQRWRGAPALLKAFQKLTTTRIQHKFAYMPGWSERSKLRMSMLKSAPTRIGMLQLFDLRVVFNYPTLNSYSFLVDWWKETIQNVVYHRNKETINFIKGEKLHNKTIFRCCCLRVITWAWQWSQWTPCRPWSCPSVASHSPSLPTRWRWRRGAHPHNPPSSPRR